VETSAALGVGWAYARCQDGRVDLAHDFGCVTQAESGSHDHLDKAQIPLLVTRVIVPCELDQEGSSSAGLYRAGPWIDNDGVQLELLALDTRSGGGGECGHLLNGKLDVSACWDCGAFEPCAWDCCVKIFKHGVFLLIWLLPSPTRTAGDIGLPDYAGALGVKQALIAS
jgi:hypothetical protein